MQCYIYVLLYFESFAQTSGTRTQQCCATRRVPETEGPRRRASGDPQTVPKKLRGRPERREEGAPKHQVMEHTMCEKNFNKTPCTREERGGLSTNTRTGKVEGREAG